MRLLRILLVLIAAVAILPAQQADTKKSGATQQASKAAPSGDLIDINSAPEATLQTLAGIGDAYSKKIIAGRPYRAKNELVQKKIIPQTTYDKIKDQIIAKQSGKK